MKEPLYISVTLDEKWKIVDFESTIEGLDYHKDEVIGKNWFDIFIELDEQNKVIDLLKNMFYSNDFLDKNLWRHITDLKMKDGNRKSIDFNNSILICENGKKTLYSRGVEHFSK